MGGCIAEAGDARLSPPPAPREFRGAWVATVGNIDWPSQPGLSSDQQKREALAILDRCKAMNLNAVVLQVRPSCDALYPSKLEPWSFYLTGKQGAPPEPFYDPLKFWIDEAHARGLELHAWFNPYRARAGAARYETAATHISKTNPSIVRSFNNWEWLDPAEPEAQRLTCEVFLDVVRRYQVDGIHIDDYFYPYPDYLTSAGQTADFPDDAPWQRYQASGGKLSREDWRRHNVNQLIQRIYFTLQRTAPHVKFGISPFGLGKPSLRPAGIVGFSQYDKLYADADLWLHEGWLDYWTPQLYWAIDKKGQEFPVLVDYWISQNRKNRHLWPGLFTSRFAPATRPSTEPATQPAINPNEIVDQIEILRSRGEKANGHVHFSMVALMRNNRLFEQICRQNRIPALVPASPWLDRKPPPRPQARLRWASDRDQPATLHLRPGWGEKPRVWAIWYRYGDRWDFDVQPASVLTLDIPAEKDGRLSAVWVSAVDRCGNESARVRVWSQ
ncbi:MAG: family 10 glycosylhydrolase [Phycisphaerae bacterium]|nr:family 10 glycosylhydrolase [Phycisphaerae bacterium]